ncbi:hypothetical protein R1sor_001622 [Riccia sorocarpa]|uniref:Uncharacterized protein n=1 Tax=Riccia sorocarpa TaxID=122646 RepID=A0ABD3GZM2_9MARC
MGKVAQTLVFKKHSDKNFDFVDYMERKGLKITLPSTETNPSQSGAAGTSTSGEGSKKLKGKAEEAEEAKKCGNSKEANNRNRGGSKEATTGTAEAPKKSTTEPEAPKKQQQEAPKKNRGGSKAEDGSNPGVSNPKKKGTPGVTELQASKLISGTSADTTGQKENEVCQIIRPTKPQSTQYPSWFLLRTNKFDRKRAPGPDNTTTSPEQSVQPATVNPNGHSGDGGSVVDSGKKNLQVVEYNDESGDEDTSSKTKKRKVAVLEKIWLPTRTSCRRN